MKVIFCVPTIKKPHQATLDSLKDSIPLIKEAGWEEGMVSEIGSPYISNARATMLKKALNADADVIVFIDHDVSWRPEDLLTLISVEEDVVAGLYRFKKDEEEYMGQTFTDNNGKPVYKEGKKYGQVLLSAFCVPAGFLKITKDAVNKFIMKYPELCYGDRFSPHIDLFNHGAHNHTWYGEDYAFSRRWLATGNPIWVVPDLSINHHDGDKVYKGNYEQFMMRQPKEQGELRLCKQH